MQLAKNLILLLETATSTCSVALGENGRVIALKELNQPNIHASHITLFINEVMQQVGKDYTDLQAVAISQGPGSYTGLRIGVSTAKGICFALGIPLIAIDTLQAMAAGLLHKIAHPSTESIFCPMIDARRMEVYTALYNHELAQIAPTQAMILDESTFDIHLSQHTIIFFGDGAEKCKPLYGQKVNAQFIDFENSAAHLSELAQCKFKAGEIVDLAYFEPYYLKDFIPTTNSS